MENDLYILSEHLISLSIFEQIRSCSYAVFVYVDYRILLFRPRFCLFKLNED